MRNRIYILFLFCVSLSFSQERKILNISRFDSPPKIDGIIDDQQWEGLTPASNFERWMPNNGSTEKKGYENYVYMGYDDNAIYIAAKFNDPNPSLIAKEFSQRDEIWESNADSFFININTNDDNISDQGFQITTAGTLGDSYTSGNSQDTAKEAVLIGEYHFNDDGWNVPNSLQRS